VLSRKRLPPYVRQPQSPTGARRSPSIAAVTRSATADGVEASSLQLVVAVEVFGRLAAHAVHVDEELRVLGEEGLLRPDAEATEAFAEEIIKFAG
jgi:hypothetical protein